MKGKKASLLTGGVKTKNRASVDIMVSFPISLLKEGKKTQEFD